MQFKLILSMIITVITLSYCFHEIKEGYFLISFGPHYLPIDYPMSVSDPAQNIFSDKGAWFGFALPDDKNINSGFVGPYLIHYKNGAWLSKSLFNLKLLKKSNDLLVDKESSNVFLIQGGCI